MYLYSEILMSIENSLFPMSVTGEWAGTKLNRFMTSGKFDVKPRKESMNEIVASSGYFKGRGKCEVFFFHSF